MNFKFIDIDQITIDDNLNILYKKEKFSIKAPILYLPFGVEKAYNNIFLKLVMKNKYYKDDTYIKFTKFIDELEQRMVSLTNKEINSQIIKNEKYGNHIISKVLNYKGKVNISVTKDKKPESFYNVKKYDYLKTELYIDKLWPYKDKFTYKIKIKNIEIM